MEQAVLTPKKRKIVKPSDLAMLKDRAKHEGRLKAWAQVYADCRADGSGMAAGNDRVREMMGFVSRQDEYERYLRRLGAKRENAEHVEWEHRAMAESFEAAVARLPANASFDDELDWVYAHPAMRRGQRMSDPSKRVTLAMEDLSPPHGPAPSQAAVNRLVNWVNHAKEFFKDHDRKYKRGQDSGKGKEEEDVGIKEAQRLLDQVRGKRDVGD